MENREQDDFSGADAVAKWLFKNGITKEEFQRDPIKWINLALRSLKSEEMQALDESGTTTLSIKGFFETGKPERVIRKIPRKIRRKE